MVVAIIKTFFGHPWPTHPLMANPAMWVLGSSSRSPPVLEGRCKVLKLRGELRGASGLADKSSVGARG